MNRARESRRQFQLSSKIVLACNDLRCLGQGARIIYADQTSINQKHTGRRVP